MRLEDELDRIGANRFHAYALTACALCSSAQSLVMNFLLILGQHRLRTQPRGRRARLAVGE